MKNNEQSLPVPDKNIPVSVVIIGSFQVGIAFLGLVILALIGQFDGGSLIFLTLVVIYGALGAGLLAIQEWARRTNVILHIIAIPYTLYTTFLLADPLNWQAAAQLLISLGIVLALSRPEIRHKFQTVVPRQKKS